MNRLSTAVQPRHLNTEQVICRDEFRTRITRALLEWVEERTGTTYIRTDEGVYKEDDTFICDQCDGRQHIDESVTVYTPSRTMARGNNKQLWCVTCRDEGAFHCRHNGEYYSCNGFTEVEIDGYTYCLERTDDIHYWESDESYHWEPESSSNADEGCNDNSDGVAGYHSLRRPWEYSRQTRPAPDAIGVELETWAKDARSHAQKALSLGLLAERDGSLDCVYGVEIIGPPMLMAEYAAAASPWLKLFNSSTFSAWNAGTEYGMHVNLNRLGMNKLHQSKLIKFIHDNRAFCEAIAGRKEVHWARYTPKRIGQCLQRGYEDKYEAAALRENRIEVRIFRATRKWESFMKNIEFCDAVRAYAAYRGICDMNLPDFIDWTRGQPGRWPHFCAWMEARIARKKERRMAKAPPECLLLVEGGAACAS